MAELLNQNVVEVVVGGEVLRFSGTESEEYINKRLEIAKKELSCISRYEYLVVNETDMQKHSAFNMHCIVEYEKHKDMEAQNRSKETEMMLKIAEENKIDKEKEDHFLKDYFI